MNTIACALLIALLLASAPVFAQVRTATIFFVPWEVETRKPLSTSDVRRSPAVRTEILSESIARSLLQWLTGEGITDPSGPFSPLSFNYRLVIDFTLEDGSVETYYANRRTLFEEKSGKVRKIDEAFKSRFSSLMFR